MGERQERGAAVATSEGGTAFSSAQDRILRFLAGEGYEAYKSAVAQKITGQQYAHLQFDAAYWTRPLGRIQEEFDRVNFAIQFFRDERFA